MGKWRRQDRLPALKSPSPFWSKDRHADRRPRLLARTRIIGALRAYFERQGFIEVEPAILQASPGNEAHLHGFATEIIGPDGVRAPAFLHTSPEFAMKKLLAAGESRIFAFSRVFRNRERGALHAPEFTMLEWYRAGAGYEALMDDCAEIVAIAAERAGARRLRFRGREADPFVRPERLSVRDAFLRYAGIDLFDSLGVDGRTGNRDADRRASHGGGPADRRRRQLVRYFQPDFERKSRARAGTWTRDDPLPLSRLRSRFGARQRRRSASGRSLRTLCLRRRTRQRLWRIDRFGRAAAAFRGGNGREAARLWRDLPDRRGLPRRARFHARRPAAPRSGSTASSCWPAAPNVSRTFNGPRSSIPPRRAKR